MGLLGTLSLGIFVALVAFLSGPVSHIIRIGGVFLTPNPTVLGEGQGPIYIEDTIHCEDVHHYRPANLLFTACEDYKNTRFSWFPPLGNLVPSTTSGSIHVVDPKTMKSARLAFTNFKGPFVTHGIDVIQDQQHEDAVYIFAVNHLPNPAYFNATSDSEIPEGTHKARSQVELFHHILGSKTIQHIRSINHPLIETPNDIYAESPESFYVTNDHFYREGAMRHVEDVWSSAKWSSIIHVQLPTNTKDTEIQASVALAGLWNNNGLGHGRTTNEMIISSAIGGELYIATPDSNHSLSISESIAFDTVTDNPSYYVDPYATSGDDVSGVVVAGISRGIRLPVTAKDPDGIDPVQVWYARPSGSGVGAGWEKRLLFEDDGMRIRTASAAVLVPVEMNGDGVKRAWLFVTGFMSERMVAVQVEL
ncbi:hypothetical protein PENARI_c006G05618 [Penicillium arizonense]|uniref:Serum paraoxonase/arylesterase family protein n=1 Tax=Penicillium arizonense TaxID=1835702 RepID=A0A1F5LNU8_PENAI|nr:hypothetical protein PENARI_c006G05618 [Penicillium arizonense]OGE54599.1 hypothetical protein PENARI_c006G05618 [Penicillium arizonense]